MNNEQSQRSANNTGSKNDSAHQRTWTEEIEVAGDELVASIKRLAAEGQVRRVRLIEAHGGIVLDVPLTIGAIAGGAVVLAAPLLAILGALAAFVAKVKIEIIREGGVPPGKSPTQ
jgi:hypothetical protein